MKPTGFLLYSIILTGVLTACVSSKSTPLKKEDFSTFIDRIFDEQVNRSPMRQTYLNIKKDYNKLDDISEQNQKKEYNFRKQYLKDLKKFKIKDLKKQDKISYFILRDQLIKKQTDFKYRQLKYPVSPFFGAHSYIPVFMINQHLVNSQKDAEDYIARIKQVQPFINEVIQNLKLREQKNMILPKFLFPKVTEQIKNITVGFPFSSAEDNFLYADFKKKITKIPKKRRLALTLEMQKALLTYYKPAYQNLLNYWLELEKKADSRAGVWKMKSGSAYYKWLVKKHTTTKLSPRAIHELGLREIQRIHAEMEILTEKMGFKGSLKEFFAFITTNSQNRRLYYPTTAYGRKSYLLKTRRLIKDMYKKLPSYFNTLPRARLIVKKVEPFREKSASLAFYHHPAPDGSKPGIYYVNLFNMKKTPAFQMEALAYHEAVPGHHLQITVSMENSDLPKFRKFDSHYTAFIEGWGLYAEKLGKEMGFYKNLYSDFGRLTMELRRAGRLVVDTGLHYKKWTRKEAIDFLLENTPDAKADHINSIDRYIVNPGQALAYTIGMKKILEVRETAKTELKEKFNIRDFHDQMLKRGAVPLSLLETLITDWIEKESNKDPV